MYEHLFIYFKWLDSGVFHTRWSQRLPGDGVSLLLLHLNAHEGEHAPKFGLLDPLPVVLDPNPPVRLDLRRNDASYLTELFGGCLSFAGIRKRRRRPRCVPELLT
jgi:hypothetical protein